VIVCVCNALRDRQICAERDRGAYTVPDLFASLNCEPRCATCVPEIEDMLKQPAYASSSVSPAADCR
jgi:bacterioferritin-associated ferredoxin